MATDKTDRSRTWIYIEERQRELTEERNKLLQQRSYIDSLTDKSRKDARMRIYIADRLPEINKELADMREKISSFKS